MLEVHPPHTTVRTWRDFFLHIATITVGLLIAISLEQSVEALHHRHQRFQLEHDLRVEARKNLHLIGLDEGFYEDKIARLNALRQYVDDPRRPQKPQVSPAASASTRSWLAHLLLSHQLGMEDCQGEHLHRSAAARRGRHVRRGLL